jgi:3-methyladenine DNA glycosylase Tag
VRFKKKVDAMVQCAKCLLSIRKLHGSFMCSASAGSGRSVLPLR